MLVFFFISAYNMSRKGVLDMAHTVNVNFKLDEDVKKRMERACARWPFYERCVYDVCKKGRQGVPHSV